MQTTNLENFNDFLLEKEVRQGGFLGAAHQVKDGHGHILHLLSGRQ